MQTIRYKTGWIHISQHVDGHEIIRAQVNRFGYTREAKSLHAAKILISKHRSKAISAITNERIK